MISGAGLCWQHVGGVGSTTTTTTSKYSKNFACRKYEENEAVHQKEKFYNIKTV